MLKETMRKEQEKHKSQMKQTPTHVQYKVNTCRTWGIDYSSHKNTPVLTFMFLWTCIVMTLSLAQVAT